MEDCEKIKNLEGEIWKDVPGYEGLYMASNMGRIKSKIKLGKEIILKPTITPYGYCVVTLGGKKPRKQLRVHRIVWSAFRTIPVYNKKAGADAVQQINHKDENPLNNKLENLELVSCRENLKYGTHDERMIKSLSKKVYQYTLDGDFIKEWSSTQECGRNGFISGAISLCCRNKYNRAGREGCIHMGFVWSYELLTKEICRERVERIMQRWEKVQGKKVYQYNTSLELIKIWNSTRHCVDGGFIQQHVCNCCNGKEKTHYGYIWSYTPIIKN